MNSNSSKKKCKHFRSFHYDVWAWVCIKCGDVLPEKDLEEMVAEEDEEKI